MILVVDDNSPDGTGRARRPAAAEREPVARAAPPGQGAASAPPTWPGSRRRSPAAPATSLEMDADFSHDPADLARLLAAARDGADLVLGSRYVPGGGVTGLGPGAAR